LLSFLSPVSNNNNNSSTSATQYGLFRVKHGDDGSETSTLIAPTFVLSSSVAVLSLGANMFYNVVPTMSPDRVEKFIHAPITMREFLVMVEDILVVVTVSALFTAGVAAMNHALCVYVRPYRRLNATLTLASEHAPLTVTACTAAAALVTGVSLVVQHQHQGFQAQSFSLMSAIFWAQIMPGNVCFAALQGRFLGQTVAASWYALDAQRTKKNSGGKQ
jgi:hypothetical protein